MRLYPISWKGVKIMTDFDKLRVQVEIFEGFRTKKYIDVAGVETIGFGFTASVFPNGKVPPSITKESATILLESLLRTKLAYVGDMLKKWGYSAEEIEILQYPLTDFTYNCGNGNLAQLTKSGLRDVTTIKKYILQYNKAGGQVYAGLTNRRQWEYDWICEKQKEVRHTSTQAVVPKEASAMDIQKLLNDKFGFSLQCDGIIGRLTRNAIYDTLKNRY